MLLSYLLSVFFRLCQWYLILNYYTWYCCILCFRNISLLVLLFLLYMLSLLYVWLLCFIFCNVYGSLCLCFWCLSFCFHCFCIESWYFCYYCEPFFIVWSANAPIIVFCDLHRSLILIIFLLLYAWMVLYDITSIDLCRLCLIIFLWCCWFWCSPISLWSLVPLYFICFCWHVFSAFSAFGVFLWSYSYCVCCLIFVDGLVVLEEIGCCGWCFCICCPCFW